MIKSNLRKLPKSVSELSKGEIEEALKKKKEYNAKALKIVEKMLENPVNEVWFIDHLKYIRQTHFEDIIEERSITKNCGYPLCSGVLKKVSHHQYHISTKLNKVYDTTERKKFCSDQCYRAGKYLKDQLLSSPLWFGSYENIPMFKLLPISNIVGIIGDEVDLGQVIPLRPTESTREKGQFASVNQFANNSLQEMHTDMPSMSTTKPPQQKESVPTCLEAEMIKTSSSSCNTLLSNISEELIISSCDTSLSIQHLENQYKPNIQKHKNLEDQTYKAVPRTNRPIHNSQDKKDQIKNLDTVPQSASTSHQPSRERLKDPNKNHKTNWPTSKAEKTNITPISVVLHVETCLREWFNLETMIFLFGEIKVRQMIVEKGKSIKEYYKVVSNASWDPKLQERYESICKRLNLMELEDNQFDCKVTAAEVRELKPLPDYTIIQEDGRKLEMKINAFYQGKVTYIEDSSPIKNQVKDDDMTPEPLLPLVDMHAQKSYRRKIIQDRLSKVLPDLLRTFDLESRDICNESRALVRTFSLEAHNIFFKPAEWSLLGLIILNMLSLKDPLLKAMLNTEQAKKYRTLMLIPYHQDSEYINTLLNWLTNIDNLVET